VSSFVGTGTGVIEEEPQGVISLTLGTTSIGRGQDSVHFFFLEVGDRGQDRFPQRQRLDLGG